MEAESEKFEIEELVLLVAFAVIVIALSFGLGWYAKQVSMVKQDQRKLQTMIEDAQSNVTEINARAVMIEQRQFELKAEIEEIEDGTRQLAASLAETVERKQLELRDVLEDIRKDVQEIADELAGIEKNQVKFQVLVERMREELGPKASLEVVSIEPAPPAVLNLGEKLQVQFRYDLGPSEAVQIWARPYTGGRRTDGYRAHPSDFYQKAAGKSGFAEGWFCFDKPAVVDEVRISMRDAATGENVHTISHKVDVRWAEAKDERTVVDVTDHAGNKGWRDKYVINLRPTGDVRKEFGVNWFRPHGVAGISAKKPDFIKTLPRFKHEMQQYLILRLGDAEDNQIVGVMDFDRPDRKYFPFDLYLDRDRDGDLAEDFIEDKEYISGISIPYSDGTMESYSLHLYSYSPEPVGVAYQVHTGRHGIFEAGGRQMQILVIDNSGNGIFNDNMDVVLMDWDLDGRIDGSHQADDDRPLYSVLELPGGKYRVVEFDPPGRRMVLQRQKQGWFKLW